MDCRTEISEKIHDKTDGIRIGGQNTMNEITVVPTRELAIIRDTNEILNEAKEAAMNLKRVISQKDKPVMFNGEQFLEFEDWQTAGQFYGYTVITGDAVPAEIDGIKGAKAGAKLLDKDGHIVGGAEAFCMRDERNWSEKPWFQIASMAQTRAGSKAFRNRLAWFVVMAGFKPTPAEEIDGVHDKKNSVSEIAGTFEMNRIVEEITEKLAAINSGNTEAMESHLKTLTTYKDKKTGEEKFLTLDQLPRVAQYKPDWVKNLHKKIGELYKSNLGTNA